MAYTYRDVKNLRWADAGETIVLVDVFFDHLNDTVPFAAGPNDEEEHGREIFARCVAGDFGPIGPYVPDPAVAMSTLRDIRNDLLRQSDFDVLPDRWDTYDEATKIAWRNYRQALRDLPENTTDPFNPVWPVKPT